VFWKALSLTIPNTDFSFIPCLISNALGKISLCFFNTSPPRYSQPFPEQPPPAGSKVKLVPVSPLTRRPLRYFPPLPPKSRATGCAGPSYRTVPLSRPICRPSSSPESHSRNRIPLRPIYRHLTNSPFPLFHALLRTSLCTATSRRIAFSLLLPRRSFQ